MTKKAILIISIIGWLFVIGIVIGANQSPKFQKALFGESKKIEVVSNGPEAARWNHYFKNN
jgi:hypothetical protein